MIKFEVRNRFTGNVQFTAEIDCSEDEKYSLKLGLAVKWAVKAGADLAGADLAGADLTRAYLAGADLTRADLTRAYLAGADLAGAYLTGADLAGAYLADADLTRAYLADADLTRAYLAGADLTGAKGIPPERITPLLMLLDQPGKQRAYKLVDKNNQGPMYGGITYEIGKTFKVDDANTDVTRGCGAGVNVATLDWCLKNWEPGYRILIVEFTAKDIAAIPTATDGKIRLHKCKVIAEKKIDPVALGLVKAEELQAAE